MPRHCSLLGTDVGLACQLSITSCLEGSLPRTYQIEPENPAALRCLLLWVEEMRLVRSLSKIIPSRSQPPLLEFHSQVSPALPVLQSLPIVLFLGVPPILSHPRSTLNPIP